MNVVDHKCILPKAGNEQHRAPSVDCVVVRTIQKQQNEGEDFTLRKKGNPRKADPSVKGFHRGRAGLSVAPKLHPSRKNGGIHSKTLMLCLKKYFYGCSSFSAAAAVDAKKNQENTDQSMQSVATAAEAVGRPPGSSIMNQAASAGGIGAAAAERNKAKHPPVSGSSIAQAVAPTVAKKNKNTMEQSAGSRQPKNQELHQT